MIEAVIAYNFTGLSGFIYQKEKDIIEVVSTFSFVSLEIKTLLDYLERFAVKRLFIYNTNRYNPLRGIDVKGIDCRMLSKDIDILANNDLFVFGVDNGSIRFKDKPRWRFDSKDKLSSQLQACGALMAATKKVYWVDNA